MSRKNKAMAQTSTSKRLRKSARVDILAAVLLVSILTSATILLEIDLLEELYTFTRLHESWEIDEIFMGVVWISIVSIIYGARRLSDIKTLNQEIVANAYYDPLTELPNRILAIDRLKQLLAGAKRQNQTIAVLFLDFDNFKTINDNYGHANGDLLIKKVGERLSKKIRQEETVARLGGDEFVILLHSGDSTCAILPTVHRILESQSEPYTLANTEVTVNFSIGIALYPKDAQSPEDLLKAADMAMYQSKKQGKSQFLFYSEDIGSRLSERYTLERGLKKAIDRQELYLVYQPQIDIQQNRICGYEALCRWNHNGREIPPEVFIEIAEDIGLINKIGCWVIHSAMTDMNHLLDKDMILAVNISPKQILRNDFVTDIKEMLKETGFPPSSLELELTETIVSRDFSICSNNLFQLRQLGISIALDDFGTGYSSLSRLKDLPVNRIKIDRSFISGGDSYGINMKIVKTILSLAEIMNLSVIAEGVENTKQLEMLEKLGCYHMQGYLFSAPVRLEQLNSKPEKLLVNHLPFME
ncbi:hypothetical protein BTA51_12095 [Hahella sp. CCB-MM4]|uniref:putative bifunctional diguanylate cyclase/phosphodiesterase n=1 Tax=Hahella sp. (strain CCB-MM4) TaxID=1926491 RepID=UPI000B9B511F|nr:EAL domain-containing protein [Hahella sp. CCB-MM4]OZG73215.1 hypothetical protein BTA51_12095 [Hahella sp. CCB-MM4]